MVYRRTATLSITASCKHGIHFDLTGRHPPSLIENRLRPFENFQTIKPTWSFFPTRTDGPALSRTTDLRSACHQVSLHLLRIKSCFFWGGFFSIYLPLQESSSSTQSTFTGIRDCLLLYFNMVAAFGSGASEWIKKK